MINTNDLHSKNIKVDKKSHRDILTFYTGYEH